MAEKIYRLLTNVRDTLIDQSCFYSFEELTDASNREIADFLVQNNLAIEARDLPPDAKRPAPQEPFKRGRGRPRKNSYETKVMVAR